MAAKYMTGSVHFESSSFMPVAYTNLELYGSTEDFGWQGGTRTDANGFFQIFITPEFEQAVNSRKTVALLRIFKDGIIVYEKSITNVSQQQSIQVPIRKFDEIVKDGTLDESSVNFTVIRGRITGKSGLPITATVRVSEEGFRHKITLTEARSSSLGYYEAKIAVRQQTEQVDSMRSITVEVLNDEGGIAAQSPNIVITDAGINIDLLVDDSILLPSVELNASINTLQRLVGNADLSSIKLDSESSEVPYLTSASGLSENEIRSVVRAHQLSDEIPVDPKFTYALIRRGIGYEIELIANSSEKDIRSAIQYSIDNLLIEPSTDAEINAAIAAIRDFVVTKSSKAIIRTEDVTVGETLNTVVGDQNLVKLYLDALYELKDDAGIFWNDFSANHGAANAQKLQQSLQMSAIAGFQPAMAAALMAKTGAGNKVLELASWTRTQWQNAIDDVATATGKSPVPKAIGDTGSSAEREAYADKLIEITQDLYPLADLGRRLGTAEGSQIIQDQNDRANVVRFITQNPEFNILKVAARDINSQNFDLSGIQDIEQLKSALKPIQALYKIVGTKPEAVIALKKANISSAADIAAMSKQQFTNQFGSAFGNSEKAESAYKIANNVTTVSAGTIATIKEQLNSFDFPVLWTNPLQVDPVVAPDLATMFGSLEQCACEHCKSVYSPAAYLVDMLHFLQTHSAPAYTELMARRPDLEHIDLTCKNTNTPVPYIDLVNELLENYILNANGFPSAPPISYQTFGTAAELAARPEHIYRTPSTNDHESYDLYSYIYDNYLKSAVYPGVLPYNLALEETRVYLNHLGLPRLETMKLYRPWSGNNTLPAHEITDRNILNEALGISKEGAEIITTSGVSNLHKYYGFDFALVSIISPSDSSVVITGPYLDVLLGNVSNAGIDVLIHQLHISYKELLELLTTKFLNPKIGANRRIKLVSKTSDVTTCVLKELKLEINYSLAPAITNTAAFNKAFFDKLYRFVRLWKATSLSIYALDQLLASLGATDITGTNYEYVARALILSKRLGISATRVTTLWSDIETERYLNYNSELQDALPSLYDTLFLNKNLLNPIDEAFNFPYDATPVAIFKDHLAAIVAALEMKEEDVLVLLGALGISLEDDITLSRLSRIYAEAVCVKASGLSVSDYLRFAVLAGFPVGGGSTAPVALTAIEDLLGLSDELYKSRFSLDELQYLLRNEDPKDNIRPKNETVALFLEKLRGELQKASQSEEARINVIIQQFAAEFQTPAALAEYVLTQLPLLPVPSPDVPVSLIEALQQEAFLNGLYELSWEYITDPTPPPGPAFPLWPLEELYYDYHRFFKIALISSRLGLDKLHVAALQDNAAELLITNLNDLPAGTVTAPALLSRFTQYERWAVLRDRFGLSPEDFLELTASIFDLTSGPSPKEAWVTKMLTITGWKEANLVQLIGDPATAAESGLLHVISPDHLRDAGRIMVLADVMEATSRIGLTANDLQKVLFTNLTVTDADRVLKAARSKHSEDAWLKIAKPLHDVLREGQRKALLAYVIAHPNGNTWRNENEVYAHFLIDVEMSPCMFTSRIKQAISSIQLFVDRVIMNLEYNGTTPVTIQQNDMEQWNRWRKWYRIWEANRKIFLYPENWIEPELRDDKSPFFKELETRLLQDDPDEGKVEDAFLEYLEKLDEVARMEPVTAYHELDLKAGIDIIHVVSRTYSQPQHYYYRRFENNRWSHWERMNLEIKGDHLTIVVWNRRLQVYWLTFIEQQLNEEQAEKEKETFRNREIGAGYRIYNKSWISNVEKGSVSLDNRVGTKEWVSFINPKLKYWHIKINWSERKEGKWTAPMVSKDTMDLRPYRVKMTDDDIANLSNYTQPGHEAAYWFLSKSHELNIHEVFKNRLYLYPSINGSSELFLTLLFPASSDDHHMTLHSFVFRDPGLEPMVLRDSEHALQMRTPPRLIANNMRFSVHPAERYLHPGMKFPVTTDDYTNIFIPATCYYTYFDDQMHANISKPCHADPPMILEDPIDLTYRITARASMLDHGNEDLGPMHNHWFYEDKTNEFFVRRVFTPYQDRSIAYGLGDMQLASIGVSGYAYLQYYLGGDAPVISTGNHAFGGSTLLTDKFATSKGKEQYFFQTFYHPHAHAFVKTLHKDGLPGLLQLGMQDQTNNMQFYANYKPTDLVSLRYPSTRVDFAFDGAYSHYNWEIFFHIPMMIAKSLSANQKFEDAQKWYHYIFNPASNTDDLGNFTESKSRFWKFRPFYIQAGLPMMTPEQMVANINLFASQVSEWEANPFQPHVIARMRILAYMKNVVMCYMDNLIAWGDNLFRRNTIESINEATQLYILCANILGPMPQSIPPRAIPEVQNYTTLSASGLDAFSNAQVQIEEFIDPSAITSNGSGAGLDPQLFRMLYFCLPGNDKLLAYWDTIADRLFKIRNCRNIEGLVQQLPLFEPPIDPALLVRAAAAGVDINSVLDSIAGIGMSHYRFSYVLQKANEFVADIRALGSELLSALEKKDAERLALLRSGQEMALLDKVTAIKEAQIREAESALESLQKTKENTNLRLQYYSSRAFMNAGEQQHLQSIQEGMALQVTQAKMETAASILSLIPQFHGQLLSAVGVSYGGQQLSTAMRAVSTAIGINGIINSAKGTMAATLGGYQRRQDDWKFQADTATKELEQLDKQIIGAEIRIDMAKRDLANHLKQMDNARETDEFMRSKFTNEELYNWMISQIAVVYFQTYQLAYDMAVKAEKCFTYEMPLAKVPAGGFIRFGYWDSLRKGLLSGQRLQQDLRKLEHSYMNESERSLELTKHISLAMLDPEAVLRLKTTGSCTFTLPKEIFDLDFPGHFVRRAKSVSISIPCIAGPYTTIAAQLNASGGVVRDKDGNLLPVSPIGATIATSTAQNDSGVFELNFRDERYLPFEGHALEQSNWTLEMMSESALRQFDYNTISDIILHVRYTAQYDGGKAASTANALKNTLNSAGNFGFALPRYFSLKHEFPNEWNAYAALLANGTPNPTLNFTLRPEQFPFFAQNRNIDVQDVVFQFQLKDLTPITRTYELKDTSNGIAAVMLSNSSSYKTSSLSNTIPNIVAHTGASVLHLAVARTDGSVTPANLDQDLEDIYLVVYYKLIA